MGSLFAIVWAWLLPVVGPILLRLMPWLGWVKQAWVWVLPALIGIVATGALAFVVWQVWPSPSRPKMVLVAEVEKQRYEAEAKALKAANAQLKAAYAARAQDLERTARENETLDKEVEALRAQAPDRTAPVFDADDVWLRRGRAR